MVETGSLSPDEWAFWDIWMQAQRLLAKEVDRVLQRDFGISKAEFGILVKLHAAPDGRMRVTDLADTLDWEKSRVAHQLTRMERRGFLERSEAGAAGRRTGIALTASGTELAARAIRVHADNIRRLAFDRLSPEQAAAIATWSEDLIDHLAP
ncbi:MarR family winged helix-turn-helix transcriptional regulator [Kribbella sp. NPDC048928]|uniref:MarR family winged helix-turn-helix transcriptional regulator n=1 Tax=Kribbella sp. NPDC048928 TaxID=3364111 RepID=UPI0037134650